MGPMGFTGVYGTAVWDVLETLCFVVFVDVVYLSFILSGYDVLWHQSNGIYGGLCACGLGLMGFV